MGGPFPCSFVRLEKANEAFVKNSEVKMEAIFIKTHFPIMEWVLP